MFLTKDFSVWADVYALGGRSTKRWGTLSVMTGLLSFGCDLLFAISLQRFLTAIGLVDGSDGPAFLGPVQGIYLEASFFLVIGVARALVIWANSVATGVCQVAFEAGARRKVSQWALWDGGSATGRVSTLFNDIVLCSGAAVSTSYYLIGRVLMVLASIVTLFYYSSTLSVVILVVLLIASPLHRLLDRQITRTSTNIQQSLANVSDRLMRGVKNSIFLHIHGLLSKEILEQRSLVGRYERSCRQYYALAAGRGTVPQILGLCVVVLIASQGSGVFAENKGELVTYLYLTMRFFQTLSDAARVTANIRGNWPRMRILVDWHRDEFLDEHSSMVADTADDQMEGASPRSVSLSLKDVSYSWGDGKTILDNVTLDLAAGSSTVVTGPSGVGKTTLLLLLCRLIRPESGQITVNFSDGEMDLKDARQKLLSVASYVGPDPFVISGTIREFLLFGQKGTVRDNSLDKALQTAHCDFVWELPDGLGHRLAEQGSGLSAGQKQRLSIARALLRNPRLLLLDEATSNLDSHSENAIIEAIKSLHGDVTVVAITHRESLKEVADTVINFEGNGKITKTQSPVKTDQVKKV